MDAQDCFGNLLYYKKRNKPCDSYNDQKVVFRLGKQDKSIDTWTFAVPEDKLPLKIDKNQLFFDLIVPSNYVPDNDVAAKAVSKLTFNVLDSSVFTAYTDGMEYLWFNHCIKKLNYSPQAQEIELFPEGHYDSYDLDAADLENTLVKSNGLTCVENRQLYAEVEWQKADKEADRLIKIGKKQEPVAFEVCHHRYKLRCPLSHGLARQPAVLPPNSKVSIDVQVSSAKKMLMRHSKYVKCRVYNSDDIVGAKNKNKFPYNCATPNPTTAVGDDDDDDDDECDTEDEDEETIDMIKMIEVRDIHALKAQCDCNTKNADGKNKIETGEYSNLENEAGTKTAAAVFIVPDTFEKHSFVKRVPHVTHEYIDGHKYGIFWKREVEKKSKHKPVMKDVKMMNVYCKPRDNEKPLATSIKGQAKIPFFYPKLHIISCSPGMKTYNIECSSGPVPYMLIFSGMPHCDISNPSYKKCITKTSMHHPDFKIKEFEILVDNYNAFLTPWKAPISHYTNFLMHNGRFENKSVGGGLDFFNFQNQNWMVPMLFDDRQGENATIQVRITFEQALSKTWDALVLKVPIDALILDSIRRG